MNKNSNVYKLGSPEHSEHLSNNIKINNASINMNQIPKEYIEYLNLSLDSWVKVFMDIYDDYFSPIELITAVNSITSKIPPNKYAFFLKLNNKDNIINKKEDLGKFSHNLNTIYNLYKKKDENYLEGEILCLKNMYKINKCLLGFLLFLNCENIKKQSGMDDFFFCFCVRFINDGGDIKKIDDDLDIKMNEHWEKQLMETKSMYNKFYYNRVKKIAEAEAIKNYTMYSLYFSKINEEAKFKYNKKFNINKLNDLVDKTDTDLINKIRINYSNQLNLDNILFNIKALLDKKMPIRPKGLVNLFINELKIAFNNRLVDPFTGKKITFNTSTKTYLWNTIPYSLKGRILSLYRRSLLVYEYLINKINARERSASTKNSYSTYNEFEKYMKYLNKERNDEEKIKLSPSLMKYEYNKLGEADMEELN